jgi:Rrf2 family protein
MRTISKRTQYGLKVMLALGSRYGEGSILTSTLSKHETIPIKFLEMILLDLKTQGLLISRRGPKGGYQLSRPPSTITIGSLIRVMEGPLAPLPCASETAFRACEECADVDSCGTRIIMRQVRDAVANVLDRTKFAYAAASVLCECPAQRDSDCSAISRQSCVQSRVAWRRGQKLEIVSVE